MPDSKQPKIRLVVRLWPDQHADVERKAKKSRLSVSNYIRERLGLPPETARARNDLKYDSDGRLIKS